MGAAAGFAAAASTGSGAVAWAFLAGSATTSGEAEGSRGGSVGTATVDDGAAGSASVGVPDGAPCCTESAESFDVEAPPQPIVPITSETDRQNGSTTRPAVCRLMIPRIRRIFVYLVARAFERFGMLGCRAIACGWKFLEDRRFAA
jgi:hypothetical protein